MRTRKTTIVLISGKAHAGKSTIKDFIMNELRKLDDLSCMSYSFANPLKFVAKAFLGWDGEKDDKGRKLLQKLGKIGRDYDKDIWCKHLLNQLDKSKSIFPENFVVIDNWRFPNEFNFFYNNPIFDVITIRVFGKGGLNGELAEDVSEISLPEVSTENFYGLDALGNHYYEYQINNSGTLAELESKIREVFASLSKNYIVE